MDRRLFAALLATLAAASARSQVQRNFPQTALRGVLGVQQPPDVLLNGRPARLAPGSRIRGQDNLLHVSGTFVGQTFTVHYTVDTYGLIKDVWVLTPAELAKRPWPTTSAEATRWRFDPIAQVWTRP